MNGSTGYSRPLSAQSEQVSATHLQPCSLFGEGDDLYAAMLEDMAQATETIRMESYIFAGDEIGLRFANVLAERARAGVRVCVHLDAAGAILEGTDDLFERLRREGVVARWFNHWRWRQPLRFNRRNHRKLLIIDRTSLYVGGFNIHRESSKAFVGCRRWRDVHVRHTEYLINHAVTLFDELWEGQITDQPPPWDGAHRLIPNSTRSCRRLLYCTYLDALRSAKRSVLLATPYFVPDRRFRRLLADTVKRGVDIRVLLPSQNDQRLVHWASRALARPLHRAGVQFFEYLPRMMHSKVTLIDDNWAMVGSANVDYRSFFVNRELNIVSQDLSLHAQLRALLRIDFGQARPLRFARRRAPFAHVIAASLARRLRRWL